MKTIFINKIAHLKSWVHWARNWRSLPNSAWIRAEQQFKARKYKEAAELYQRGLRGSKKNRASYEITLKLAQCWCKVGKYREAIRALYTAIEQNPRDRGAYVFLARLEMWLCRPKDALNSLGRLLSVHAPDAEIAALFLIAAIDAKTPSPVLMRAQAIARNFASEAHALPLLALALARFDYLRGRKEKGMSQIEGLCRKSPVFYEAHIAMGEILLREGNTLSARHHLRKALSMSTQHPRIQALLAESYLVEGPGRSPEYALQLASSACCNSLWEQPRVMHLLAEAYSQCGKKMEAQLVASRVRELDTKEENSSLVDDYEMAV